MRATPCRSAYFNAHVHEYGSLGGNLGGYFQLSTGRSADRNGVVDSRLNRNLFTLFHVSFSLFCVTPPGVLTTT